MGGVGRAGARVIQPKGVEKVKESDNEGDREGKLKDVWKVVKSQRADSGTIGEEE